MSNGEQINNVCLVYIEISKILIRSILPALQTNLSINYLSQYFVDHSRYHIGINCIQNMINVSNKSVYKKVADIGPVIPFVYYQVIRLPCGIKLQKMADSGMAMTDIIPSLPKLKRVQFI